MINALALNTEKSPYFRRGSAETVFPQNFLTGKLDEITNFMHSWMCPDADILRSSYKWVF